MSQADSLGQPSPPSIFPIYRAFYVLPTDNVDSSVVRIDFFVSRSVNGMGYEGNRVFAYGDNATGFFAVHTGLDENTFYAYRCQYVCSDGSKTSMGQITEAGPAQLIASSDLNIDQLASRAYSTGLITSGIFQGVIFRTSPVDPKVQMDPTGIWANDASGRKSFYLHADGSAAYFSGQVDLQESSVVLDPATPSEISWGGQVLINLSDEQDNPGTNTWQDVSSGGWNWSLLTDAGDYWSTWVGPLANQQFAGAGADNGSNGGVNTWSNPNSITASGGTQASVVFDKSLLSHYLQSSAHGFTIPSTATVSGIQVFISRIATRDGAGDNRISLVKAGVVQTTNKARATNWPTAYAVASYGGPTDLWGTTWTPSDVNNVNFGAVVSILGADNTGIASVDWIQIAVYYTDTGISDQLVTTNYGFNIPPNASIKGIQLNLTTSTSSNNVHDSTISLVKGGTVQSTNKATNTWANGNNIFTFGGATDLWGTTWAPADINSSGFGAAISVLDTVDTAYQTLWAHLYGVDLIVYYQALQLGTNSEWIQGAISSGHHALMAGAVNQTVTIIDDAGNSSFLLGNTTAATIYRNTAWTSGNAVVIKVLFDAVEYDLGSNFDSLNHRYKVPVAGVYSVKALVSVNASTDLVAILYKNGSQLATGTESVTTANDYRSLVCRDVQCAANDYFEIFVYTSPSVAGTTGADSTYMSVVRVA